MAPSRTKQSQISQAADPSRRASRRKRISQVHRGALVALDTAVESRRDTEQVSADYDIRREDVQDAFAWQTRFLVRRAESLLRSLQQQLDGVDALLRGEKRPARKAQDPQDPGRAA